MKEVLLPETLSGLPGSLPEALSERSAFYIHGCRGVCLHCKRERYIQCRSLCNPCYANATIRHLYPVTQDSDRTGRPEELLPPFPREKPKPTQALPGSEEKIQVLMERVWSGQYLWHREDASHDDLNH